METVLTKVTLPLSVLQEMVSKAVKGSTMVDVIPLSCLMQIKVQDNTLTVRATDNSTHVIATAQVQCDNFEFCVNSRKFAAIISKLSCAEITLIVEEKKLSIHGNGVYNIPVELDNGNRVVFPDVMFNPTSSTKHVISSEFHTIISLNKSCKSNNKEIPCLYNYYFDNEKTLTTDQYKFCYNPVVVSDTPIMVTPNVIDLANDCLDDEYGVDICHDATSIMFYSENTKANIKYYVIGRKSSQADLDAFPVAPLMEVLTKQTTQSREINRSDLRAAADRMTLFTDVLDKTKVSLSFQAEGVVLSEEGSQSTELVKYADKSEVEIPETSMNISCADLINTLNAFSEKMFISYLQDTGVCLTSGNIKLMICQVGEGE